MKCLIYGIYLLEVVQSALITENGFRQFVTRFGNVQVFNRVETAWLSVPTLTAICELSCTKHGQVSSNIPPRYILCPGILCSSDPHFGTIEETSGDNYCCKFSKEVYYIQDLSTVKMLYGTQLSFIQLGGGIAIGVREEQRKYFTLFWGARPQIFEWSTIAVWTTTQVCSQLSNDIICRCGMLGASFVISLLLYA